MNAPALGYGDTVLHSVIDGYSRITNWRNRLEVCSKREVSPTQVHLQISSCFRHSCRPLRAVKSSGGTVTVFLYPRLSTYDLERRNRDCIQFTCNIFVECMFMFNAGISLLTNFIWTMWTTATCIRYVHRFYTGPTNLPDNPSPYSYNTRTIKENNCRPP